MMKEHDLNNRIKQVVYSALQGLEVQKHIHVHRPSKRGISLVLSIVTNLTLLGAMVNTYFRNDFFRLWVNGAMDSITQGALVFGVILGLMVHVIFLHDKFKNTKKE